MEFDPNDPDPEVGRAVFRIIAALIIVGLTFSYLPNSIQERAGKWIGSSYRSVVTPSVTLTYRSIHQLILPLWQKP